MVARAESVAAGGRCPAPSVQKVVVRADGDGEKLPASTDRVLQVAVRWLFRLSGTRAWNSSSAKSTGCGPGPGSGRVGRSTSPGR
jgi:hypothetical protein